MDITMTENFEANQHQNTPSGADLEAQLAADEASRYVPNEPDEAPVPEAEKPAQEAAEAPPEADPEPEAKADPEPDEFEKRISRMAFEKRAAEKAVRQLQERLDRLEGKAPPLEKDAEFEQQVEIRAKQLAAQNAFNERGNQVYRDGVKAFPDFDSKLAALNELGGISPQLQDAACEAGDAHKILHYLGKNLDEAERIMKMPPAAMGAALAKIDGKINTPSPPKPQSKAPPPIKPLAGKGTLELDDEKMPLAEYMKREDARWRERGRR